MSIPSSPPRSGVASPADSPQGVRAVSATSPADASRRVLIVGATSAIAVETARAYAEAGARFCLAARNAAKLEAVADDLRVRGAAEVATMQLDVADLSRHQAVIDAAAAALGGFDVALIAHGVLPDQRQCEQSVAATLDALNVNFTSTVAFLTRLAERFERQRRGCIAVITSVAGDRGRRRNYVYASTKAGLDAFLQGLRARLHRAGVTVLTIKPGFVDTPMTAASPKNPLFASPRRVGRAIHRAIEANKDVVYVPAWWRLIMFAVRALPERLFKRLDL